MLQTIIAIIFIALLLVWGAPVKKKHSIFPDNHTSR